MSTTSGPETPAVSAALRTWTLVALGIATIAAFAPAFRADWILFDDPVYVLKNPYVHRGLTGAGLRHFMVSSHGANWHPLTSFSHMLDVSVFGLSPMGPHAENVLLHLASALLAALVLQRYTRRWWPSFAVATLFALHPLRVESVAWISERKDVLSGLFFWLTLDAYQRWIHGGGGLRYAWLILSCTLGLMAKPMLVTLPFVLLLLDAWPLERLKSMRELRPRVLEKWPLFAVAVASAIVTYFVQRDVGAVITEAQIPFAVRGPNAVASVSRYIGMIFWPRGLAVFYPLTRSFSLVLPVISAIIVAVLTCVSWRLRRSYPSVLVGWLWFLGVLVPVIGLVQVGTQAYADRYTYLPSVGLAIAVIFPLFALADRHKLTRNVALVGFVALATALAWSTNRQTALWADTNTLFEHTLQVTDDNALAEQVYGNSFLEVGRLDEAIDHLNAALRLVPDFPDARNNLGSAYGRKGLYEEALVEFYRSQKIQDTADVHHNIGYALAQLKRFDEAVDEYEAALRIDPLHEPALEKLAAALGCLGRLDEAGTILHRALALRPDDVELQRSMAVTCTLQDKVEEGVGWYESILRRDANDLDALNNIAWIRATHHLAEHRDGALAVRYAERAVASSPSQNSILQSTLAAAYAESGRFEEAIKSGELAVQLARSSADEDAVQRFEKQLQMYRENKPYHF